MNAFLIIPAFGLFIGALVWRRTKAVHNVKFSNRTAADILQIELNKQPDCHVYTGNVPPNSVDYEVHLRDRNRQAYQKSASKN
jgi:hypothetical protein